jgi:hypothetical protein
MSGKKTTVTNESRTEGGGLFLAKVKGKDLYVYVNGHVTKFVKEKEHATSFDQHYIKNILAECHYVDPEDKSKKQIALEAVAE